MIPAPKLCVTFLWISINLDKSLNSQFTPISGDTLAKIFPTTWMLMTHYPHTSVFRLMNHLSSVIPHISGDSGCTSPEYSSTSLGVDGSTQSQRQNSALAKLNEENDSIEDDRDSCHSDSGSDFTGRRKSMPLMHRTKNYPTGNYLVSLWFNHTKRKANAKATCLYWVLIISSLPSTERSLFNWFCTHLSKKRKETSLSRSLGVA